MRHGNKIYMGPATIPTNAYTYPASYLKSGWQGSIGAIVRIWQDLNGAGDRTPDSLIFWPGSYDGTTYNYQASNITAPYSFSAAVPGKAANVATITSALATVSGSPIVTRSSGSFISDGAREGHILSMASATNIPFGSVILSVDSATQVTLDRNATATASGFTGNVSKVPLVCHTGRVLWQGTTPSPLYWPIDLIQVAVHTASAGTADLTGVMVEAWPIFDFGVLDNQPPRYGLAG